MNIQPSLVSCLALLASAGLSGARDTLVLAEKAVVSPNYIMVRPLPLPQLSASVINTSQTDYVQSEFSGMLPGMEVRVDSVVFHPSGAYGYGGGGVRGSLEVHWRWANATDSLDPATSRVQDLRAVPIPALRQIQPYTIRDSGGTIWAPASNLKADLNIAYLWRNWVEADTVYSCNQGRCVYAGTPQRVRNWEGGIVLCALPPYQPDSAAIRYDLWKQLHTGSLAVRLDPAGIVPMTGSRWSRDPGGMALENLAAALPGNRANWWWTERSWFDVRPLVYTSGQKPSIPSQVSYATGKAQYVYNRSFDPNLRILELDTIRLVDDTLKKIGSSLFLDGTTRRRCGTEFVDSLAGRSSWLVVSSQADSASIVRGLEPDLYGRRQSAWRMTGDTVWLDGNSFPVPLAELLGQTSLRGESAIGATRLSGANLSLSAEASVTVRDLSGRRLMESLLPAGDSKLELGAHRGAFVVQVRESVSGRTVLLHGSLLGR